MPRSRKIRKYADFEIPTEIERSELEVVIGTPDHSGRWTTRAMYKHHTALRVRRLTGSMALSKQNRMTPCHEVHISSFVFINRKLHEFFFTLSRNILMDRNYRYFLDDFVLSIVESCA